MTKQSYPCFYQEESPQHYKSLNKTTNKSTKKHIHDHFIFLKILTTPLATIWTEVLTFIKWRIYIISFIHENGTNTRNPNMFCLFHLDHDYEVEECHALETKIEIFITKGYLHHLVKEKKMSIEERKSTYLMIYLTSNNPQISFGNCISFFLIFYKSCNIFFISPMSLKKNLYYNL